jgi:transcriptional regulator with XRE-family HTH domain
MTSRNPIENLGQSLGEYLREQRTTARLSLRQLADLAGVSNPYLSQIERGVKKPSAEILQQLAKGLQISSESLYVKAGFLDERTVSEHRPWDVEAAVTADPALSERQKSTLIDIYRSFVGDTPTGAGEVDVTEPPARTSPTRTTSPTSKTPAKKRPDQKAAAKKASPGRTGSSTGARKPGAPKRPAKTAAKSTKTTKTTTNKE